MDDQSADPTGALTLPPELTPPGVVILAGAFGSGKTEIAVNLAVRWAQEVPTSLADLDIVTPYFRSRDAKAALAEAGVEVISPSGDADAYDVPVLPQSVAGNLGAPESGLIIDVGGEPHGAAVLAHWREALLTRDAKLCLVINPRRPRAETPGEVADLGRRIAAATGLRLSGIIANGNLGPDTVLVDVQAGLQQARRLETLLDVPILAVCCPTSLLRECDGLAEGVPSLPLSFYMRPVWARGMTP